MLKGIFRRVAWLNGRNWWNQGKIDAWTWTWRRVRVKQGAFERFWPSSWGSVALDLGWNRLWDLQWNSTRRRCQNDHCRCLERRLCGEIFIFLFKVLIIEWQRLCSLLTYKDYEIDQEEKWSRSVLVLCMFGSIVQNWSFFRWQKLYKHIYTST